MVFTTDEIIKLTDGLAWPTVALIALVVLLPRLRDLTQFAANLNRLVDRSNELVTVVATLNEVGPMLSQVTDQLAELKGMQEVVLSGRDANSQLTPAGPTSSAELDKLWVQIEQAWEELKEVIGSISRNQGVKANFMGSVGVSKTLDDLVARRAVKAETMEKIKDLAGKWQWMFRTTTPQDDWLNQSVVESFVKGCRDARAALLGNK